MQKNKNGIREKFKLIYEEAQKIIESMKLKFKNSTLFGQGKK